MLFSTCIINKSCISRLLERLPELASEGVGKLNVSAWKKNRTDVTHWNSSPQVVFMVCLWDKRLKFVLLYMRSKNKERVEVDAYWWNSQIISIKEREDGFRGKIRSSVSDTLIFL